MGFLLQAGVACGHFYTPLSYSPLVVGCLTLIMAAAIGLGQSCVTCETLGRVWLFGVGLMSTGAWCIAASVLGGPSLA